MSAFLFRELLQESVDQPIMLITTATTGLKPGVDKLLAVAVSKYDDGVWDTKAAFQSVAYEDACKGAEYHKIAPYMLETKGMQKEEFATFLEQLKAGTCFTYNPDFHRNFIAQHIMHVPKMYNLPLLLKGLKSRIALRPKDCIDLTSLQKSYDILVGKPPGIYKVMELEGLADMPITSLPFVHMLSVLRSLLELALDQQVLVLDP